MPDALLTKPDKSAIPVIALHKQAYPAWLKRQDAFRTRWLKSIGFEAEAGTYALIPNARGDLAAIAAGIPEQPDLWSLAYLPSRLPMGSYKLENHFNAADAEAVSLGWALASYQFTRYRKNVKKLPRLVLSDGSHQRLLSMAQSICWVRDLINTPANDMMPSHLAREAQNLAKEFKARCTVIAGDELLKKNYPMIHTVGRASTDEPRLIDIRWGKETDPKLTLVGKGVCFDSGGLDIKSTGNMKLMKKDMGGAANVLGLARMIMANKLPVRLRVLIPAVENAIAGNAMRPLDIAPTRKGMHVEIGNTDAEGRLILCDALTEADSESPDLLLDFATLTGAARVALGTDVPAFFTADKKLAAGLLKHADQVSDPVWQLPLHRGYRDKLNTATADISNDPDSGYGGAITAALFLKEFVSDTTPWVHVDLMAWNLSNRPGRPQGGEAMAIRAFYSMIEERYGHG